MDIKIKKGTMQHRKDCEEALLNSELGKRYFASEGSGESAVLEGLEQGNLYIALIKDRCAGFFLLHTKGVFSQIPLLTPHCCERGIQRPGDWQKVNRLPGKCSLCRCSQTIFCCCRFQSGSEAFLRKKWLSAGGGDSRPLQRGNNGIHYDEEKMSEARPDKDS